MTQEELGERFGVSSRSVSRWENGTTLPDLSLLLELARFYGVTMEELLDGERRTTMEYQKDEAMDKVAEKAAVYSADYNRREKKFFTRQMMIFLWGANLALWAFMLLEEFAPHTSPYFFWWGVCLGIVQGVLILAMMYTCGLMEKFRKAKLGLAKEMLNLFK